MASSVASNNQPSTEGQHGHGATQRQQISGVVHLEADGLFECRNNQAHNNHIGQIVLQALEAVHRGNACVLLLQPSRRGLRSNLLIRSKSDQQNLRSWLRHVSGPNKSLICNEC